MTKLQSAFLYHRSRGGPASRAITLARADVAAGESRWPYEYPRRLLPQGWGNARSDDGATWVENLDAAGLRFVGFADDLARLRHTGWYTSDDNDLGESLRGVVLRMTARDGMSRYLPAYEDPNNPSTYRVEVGQFFTGDDDESVKYDCAYAADRFAERCAEQERDYNRAWQAGRRYEDLAEEVASTRKDLLAVIREARASCKGGTLGPAIRRTVAARIEEGLESIREARAKRAELFDGFARQPGWEG